MTELDEQAMHKFRMSTTSWRWLICVLTAAAAVLLIADARYALRPIAIEHVQGTLGVTLNDHIDLHPESHGSYQLRVLEVDPGSPLLAYGVKAGDEVVFDRPLDRGRRFQVGEVIGLTLIRPSGPRHVSVAALASPVPFAEAVDYIGRFLLAIPTLLFAVVVGVKHGDTTAQRALAKTFCALNLIFFMATNYSPATPMLMASKLLSLAIYPLIWYWCVIFTLNYHSYPSSTLRRRLERSVPWYLTLVGATAVYSVWYGLGNEAPLMLPLTGAVLGGAFCISLLSAVDGWRRTSGEMRQRHQWLLASFACGALPALISWIPGLDAGYDGASFAMMAMLGGQMLMYVGLAYAMLRHRVFDFNFAVSRMVVFSVISILLLSVIFVAEQISSSILHGGGHADAPTATLAIDGLIALAVYVVFHHLHGYIERWVERFLFRQWHENERKLRQYVNQAVHITTADALSAAFRVALDRFTGQSGCAIYVKQAEQHFTRVAGTLEHTPTLVDANDSIALILRTENRPVPLEPQLSTIPGDLVVPMSHRGELNGFVVIGSKRSGAGYRPDELEALAFAAHETGVGLHSLRVDMLEQEMQELTRRAELQSAELALMAGRRKSARVMIESTTA
ncbi:MAG: hypothetical protein JWR56_68 [Massilia sp.]|nr:hypothetical protein [Massilia sp.]